jgi:hypothetical protein
MATAQAGGATSAASTTFAPGSIDQVRVDSQNLPTASPNEALQPTGAFEYPLGGDSQVAEDVKRPRGDQGSRLIEKPGEPDARDVLEGLLRRFYQG